MPDWDRMNAVHQTNPEAAEMNKKIAIAAAFFLVANFAGVALAGHHEASVTVQGEVMCAMCVMKTEGAKDCQNVLRVKKGDDAVDYYIVKNEVAEKFGHACSGAKAAQVTGTVVEKEGKMWLTATKMVPVEKKA